MPRRARHAGVPVLPASYAAQQESQLQNADACYRFFRWLQGRRARLRRADKVVRRGRKRRPFAPRQSDLDAGQVAGDIADLDPVAFKAPGPVDKAGQDRQARAGGDKAAKK